MRRPGGAVAPAVTNPRPLTATTGAPAGEAEVSREPAERMARMLWQADDENQADDEGQR